MIYLYKKTHNATKLRYLGKTTKNPHKYSGSGKYWLRHLKLHGNDVTTEILRECTTAEELKHWGAYFSELWDIVNAVDDTGKKLWANLRPETGDGGATRTGETHPMKSKITRDKISGANHYSKKEGYIWKLVGNNHPMKDEQVRLSVSGKSHHTYDPTSLVFYHKSGIIEHCTVNELREKYNLSVAIRQVVSGNEKSYKGWRITPIPPTHASKGVPKTSQHKNALRVAKQKAAKTPEEVENTPVGEGTLLDRNELLRKVLADKKTSSDK